MQKYWNRSVDRNLSELHLKSVHSIQLKELGTFLGQLDGDTSSRTMRALPEQAGAGNRKSKEKGWQQRERIGNRLGVMGGIFLVVILI